MSVFYLVRHAHADWSADENRPLSSAGLEGADRAADLLEEFPIDYLYSSPYRRARQTIEPLASRLDMTIKVLPDLRERQLGNHTGRDFIESVRATWRDPSFAYPGGETNAAAQERGVQIVLQLHGQHPARHIVLSTHGNLLALILQHFDPSIGFLTWKTMTMPDIYELRFTAGGEAAVHRLWAVA